MRYLYFLCLFPWLLYCEKIETFYGILEVEEPVLLELIASPAFQRLKGIHQYGVSYYTTHREEYTRYEHSLGVFAVLRLKGASLHEQIAGLLHDVSHTVFSHVGDFMFSREYQEEDYQNSIHEGFLEKSGLGAILRAYSISPEDIMPLEELFPALEQPKPNLCADRIDYNIQGAYYRGFITREEGRKILEDLDFVEGIWVSRSVTPLDKIASFALFMTLDCWSSPTNHFASRILADAMFRAIEIYLISWDDVHFGTDDDVWDRLLTSPDSDLKKLMSDVFMASTCFELVDPSYAERVLYGKFSGIDPWVLVKGEKIRLSQTNPSFAQEYERVYTTIKQGWGVRLLF